MTKLKIVQAFLYLEGVLAHQRLLMTYGDWIQLKGSGQDLWQQEPIHRPKLVLHWSNQDPVN